MIPQNSIEFPVFQGILSESPWFFPSVPHAVAVLRRCGGTHFLALAAVGHGASHGHGSEIELERMALGFIHM